MIKIIPGETPTIDFQGDPATRKGPYSTWELLDETEQKIDKMLKIGVDSSDEYLQRLYKQKDELTKQYKKEAVERQQKKSNPVDVPNVYNLLSTIPKIGMKDEPLSSEDVARRQSLDYAKKVGEANLEADKLRHAGLLGGDREMQYTQ